MKDLKNNQPPADPTILATNLDYIREDKVNFALLLWEMSELYLIAHDCLSDEQQDQFRSDCITFRQIIKHC